MRTPETLTAARRAASLQQQVGTAVPNLLPTSSQDSMTTPVSNKPNLSPNDKRVEAARAALITPSRNATANIDPMDEADGSVTILSIDDIEPYKHNPRTEVNPKYAEIKASMIAEGRITNTIMVTRRSPKEKYFPYGGGNTRIQIAKELYAAGDKRFATLHVITKKWASDSSVITAHLSENDNRGDISFWDRAQGVMKFKEHFERESGRVLSASDLNKELKNNGLSYGIKMVQNFIFAIDNLSLIGKFLKSREINESIRPSITAILDAGQKFNKKDEVKDAMDEIMLMHGQDLESTEISNREKDPAERLPPQIDLTGFIHDLQTVAAKVLKLDVDCMPAITQAIAENPKISPEEIKKIQRAEDKNPINAGKKSPLGGMLSGLKKHPKENKSSDSSAVSNKPNNSFDQHLISAIANLNAVVPVADFLKADPRMPYGFFVDLPASTEQVNGEQLTDEIAGLREALWPVLASFSGQANEALAGCIPADSRWGQMKVANVDAMTQACAASGVAFRNGILYVTSAHIWMLMSHPEAGPVFMNLVRVLAEGHAITPGKFNIPFLPLFS